MSARIAIVLSLLALGACRKGTPPESTAGTFDGTLDEVLPLLAARSHMIVMIDPSAHALASCARLRVVIPAGANLSQLPDLVSSGLRNLGMTLTTNASGWVVSQSTALRVPYPRECFGRGLANAPSPLAPMMPTAPPTPFPVALGDGGIDPIGTGITRISDTEFTLTRAARDQLFADASRMLVRVMPVEVDGHVTGIRFFGIRAISALGRLGFQNGDELQRIDGSDVTSPERALEVYSRVRSANECTLSMVRRGAPIELHYRVTP